MFLLSRLVAEDKGIWPVIERRVNELPPYTLGVVNEFFAAYPGEVSYGLDPNQFIDYAMKQFRLRTDRVEQAQHKTRAEVYKLAVEDIEQEGAKP